MVLAVWVGLVGQGHGHIVRQVNLEVLRRRCNV